MACLKVLSWTRDTEKNQKVSVNRAGKLVKIQTGYIPVLLHLLLNPKLTSSVRMYNYIQQTTFTFCLSGYFTALYIDC